MVVWRSNDQKKICHYLQAFPWLQNYQNNDVCVGWFQEKGPNLKSDWQFWCKIRSSKEHFDNSWSFGCNLTHIWQSMVEKVQPWAKASGKLKKIGNGSLKSMIWHFRLKNHRCFPHCSALCWSIFKSKVKICSSRISPIQKWPKLSDKMAKKCQ